MRWGGDLHQALSRLIVSSQATLREAMEAIDAGSESIAFVADDEGRIIGTLSDGDVRRILLRGRTLDDRCLLDAMRREFAFVTEDTDRAVVLDIMRARDVGQLPILDA